MGEAGGEPFRGFDLDRVLHVDERTHMEIAVADVTDDRRDEAA